jgi:hypothetical protein
MSEQYRNSAKVEQEALNYSTASTSTYYASSVAPVSKQDDQQSLYTYASHMDAQAYVKRIGDRVNPSRGSVGDVLIQSHSLTTF